MSLAKTCSRCAAPLPDDAPEDALCRECEAESEGTIALPEQDLQLPVSPTPLSTRGFSLPVAHPQVASIGDYEIIDKLGQGGMGAVYRARQISLDRVVALKVLPQQFEEDDDFVARFQREATVAARLNHPNLVRVYSSGVADGSHYIAMELIEGENLRQRMKREPVPMGESLRICADVARALQCGWDSAHLIHRDIKPANIYLSHAGEVKLGDLGLAKSTLANTTGITQTGTSLGTPLYMSPEQGKGEKGIDFRSDIYSLGCTLYELLTGKPPYEGRDGHTLIHQHIHAPLPAILKVLPGCPMPLVRLVGKMLRKQPRERHASYEDLIAEMEHIREQLESGAPAAGPSKVVEAWKQVGDIEAAPATSYGLLWAGLATLLLVGAGVAFFALGKKQESPSAKASVAKTQPVSTKPKPVSTPTSTSVSTLAATPTALRQSAAIKLWTGAFASSDPRRRWENGIIRLDGLNLSAASVNVRDGIVRGSVRANPDARSPVICLRHASDGEGYSSYGLELLATKGAVHLGVLEASKSRLLQAWPLPRAYGPDEWVRLELKAVGDELTASVDGQVVGTVRDATVLGPGAVNLFAASNGFFRDIEYIPLDGVPEAEALKLAGVPPAAPLAPDYPQPREWIDATEDVRHRGLREGKLKAVGDWLEAPAKAAFLIAEQTNFSNVALRVVFSGSVTLKLRRARTDRFADAYSAHVASYRAPRGEVGLSSEAPDDKTVPLQDKWKLFPVTERADESHEMVFSAVGSQLSLWMDGQQLHSVTDTRLSEGLLQLSFEAKPGSLPSRIKRIEYGKLDAPGASAPPAAERWENLLLDPEMQGKLRKTAEGYIVSTAATLARGRDRDGAVRCRVRFDPSDEWFRILAGKEETRWYQAAILGSELGANAGMIQYVDTTLASGKFADASNLVKTRMKTTIQPGQFVDVELRIVGDTLRLSLNGEVVSTARDTRLGLGRWGISGNTTLNNTLIQSLEYLDLSAKAPSIVTSGSGTASATPATATKDAPFVNSLGMKFVPVPITGGPTDGQRVLFSIWETRVQDYEVFANDTGREWPKPNFAQGPTHPAINVHWNDATAFCAWLTTHEHGAGRLGANEVYRLPTDHEWSCAVGIGGREDHTLTPGQKNDKVPDAYPWEGGWPPPPRAGNYGGEELRPVTVASSDALPAGYRDDFPQTAPVGSFLANGLGIYDLGGNVSEWTADWQDPKPERKTLRGENWNASHRLILLSSHRSADFLTPRSNRFGFRVVLAPAP